MSHITLPEHAGLTNDFSFFADTIPHIVWMASAVGVIEYFNRQASEYTGAGSGALLGDSWLIHVHPDDAGIAAATWAQALSSGDPTDIAIRLRRHDGQFRWHLVRAAPMRGDSGQIFRWIGTATDIDDQRRSEEDLRRSERASAESLQLLEILQSEAPIGFGFVDRALRVVRQNGMLAALSDAGLDWTGRSRADAPPAPPGSADLQVGSVLETGEPVINQELCVTVPGERGRSRRLLGSCYPVRVDGEMIGVGVVVVDITERREADEARREFASAAMAAISAAVEARDPYTAGHQRRVAVISAAIATEIGLGEEVDSIRLAAQIHDIGKLGIPVEILACSRRLMPAEFELVKTHAQIGFDIISGIPFGAPIAEMILQHHERNDGSGYPNGCAQTRSCSAHASSASLTPSRPWPPTGPTGLHSVSTPRSPRSKPTVAGSTTPRSSTPA